jgi:hypothetical protein
LKKLTKSWFAITRRAHSVGGGNLGWFGRSSVGNQVPAIPGLRFLDMSRVSTWYYSYEYFNNDPKCCSCLGKKPKKKRDRVDTISGVKL